VEARELEVQDAAGRWYSLRIRPYKDLDNRIDGAVLALLDIDAIKRHEQELAETRALASAVVDTTDEPLAVLDEDLRLRLVNAAFRRRFVPHDEETLGREFAALSAHDERFRLVAEQLHTLLARGPDDLAAQRVDALALDLQGIEMRIWVRELPRRTRPSRMLILAFGERRETRHG